MRAIRERSPCLLLDSTAVDKNGWPLEKRAFRFLQGALHLCLFWWVIDSCELVTLLKAKRKYSTCPQAIARLLFLYETKAIKERFDQCRARWVISWLVILAILWLVNPGDPAIKILFGFAATLRLIEIYTTGLGTILQQDQQIGARNLTTLSFYFGHIVLIFAILYHCVPGANFTIDLGPNHLPSASSIGDYLYTSLAYVTSLGGEYKPKGNISEFLTVITTMTSLFLFTVLIAFGIEDIKKGKGDEGVAQTR